MSLLSIRTKELYIWLLSCKYVGSSDKLPIFLLTHNIDNLLIPSGEIFPDYHPAE